MPDSNKRSGPTPEEGQGNKVNEGPERLSPELDSAEQWDDVASDRGFQKGDQGGYKGSYDETKYDQNDDKDVNPDETRKMRENAAATSTQAKGSRDDDDGRKSPLTQNEHTLDKRTKT